MKNTYFEHNYPKRLILHDLSTEEKGSDIATLTFMLKVLRFVLPRNLLCVVWRHWWDIRGKERPLPNLTVSHGQLGILYITAKKCRQFLWLYPQVVIFYSIYFRVYELKAKQLDYYHVCLTSIRLLDSHFS